MKNALMFLILVKTGRGNEIGSILNKILTDSTVNYIAIYDIYELQ
jgi:hypothetical protein